MFTLRRCGGVLETSSPKMRICPPVGFSKPEISRRQVVLPDPEGPSIAKKDPSATRFDRLTHSEVLENGLAVMDVAAVALARENAIPIVVFSIHEKGGFTEILTGGGRATIVTDN